MKNKKTSYKEFKNWLDEQVTLAECMQLEENFHLLPEMLEENAQALALIQEMLEDHTLHYQAKRKPKHKNKTAGKRPNMVEVLINLYKIDCLIGTLEALQEDVKQKYQGVFCETWLELDELTSGLIHHCLDYITTKESHLIDKIQEQEQERESKGLENG